MKGIAFLLKINSGKQREQGCGAFLDQLILAPFVSVKFMQNAFEDRVDEKHIVVKENGAWRLVCFMPTSSIRFEKWGAKSVDEWGLKMIVGKTTMGEATAAMMKEKKCVHVSPRSVSPNLWIDSIEVQDVYLYDELGKIEAAWFFGLKELGPFIVDIDTEGNNFFDKLDGEITKRKAKALTDLGIDPSFEFTKLY